MSVIRKVDMPNWNRFVASVLSGKGKDKPDKRKDGEKMTFASSLTSEKGGENHGKK